MTISRIYGPYGMRELVGKPHAASTANEVIN